MPIDDNIGLRVRKTISADPGVDRSEASALIVSTRGAPARRALLVGVFVILFATMVYIGVEYGFHAVVRCEMETNSALAQDRGAISEIAMSDACGF